MSYCLNPNCNQPKNPQDTKFCLSCGTKLILGDRYRSIKLIGQGGFGKTYLAVDEYKPSKPRCVIKQLFPHSQGISNLEKATELFIQEAIQLDELGEHSQIPSLLAHFTQDGQQYLVQEFIDGQNLAQELEANGAFKENKIQFLLKDLLPVIQFIHEQGVIHRDIKPDNIIRRSLDDKLVLVDFGAAKIATGTALAKTGTSIGTAQFVAPEQAIGKATFASDIYSLGVTCIYLLTQTNPFDLYSVSEGNWIWRDYLTTPVSDQLGQILDKTLENATNRRYQSATAILHDLNPINIVNTPISISQTYQDKLPISPVVKAFTTPQTQNWKCVQTFLGHTELFAGVTTIAISPDGELLVSGSEDNTIKVWRISTAKEIRTLKEHSHFIQSVAISPDGELLASAGDDQKIKLWNLKTGNKLFNLEKDKKIRCVTFSPDGQILAACYENNTIDLWKLDTKEKMRSLSGIQNFKTISFHPSGDIIASGEEVDYNLRLWNVATGQELFKMTGHSNTIRAVKFSPDGQIVASGSCDKTIKLWKVETGELLHTLTGHLGMFAGVNGIAFSPDGEVIASGSDDNTIKLWNVSIGKEIITLRGHTRGVSSVAFTPDGLTLTSGSWDKVIKLWRCN